MVPHKLVTRLYDALPDELAIKRLCIVPDLCGYLRTALMYKKIRGAGNERSPVDTPQGLPQRSNDELSKPSCRSILWKISQFFLIHVATGETTDKITLRIALGGYALHLVSHALCPTLASPDRSLILLFHLFIAAGIRRSTWFSLVHYTGGCMIMQ